MTQQSENILTGFPVVIGLIAVTLASASSIGQMEGVVFTACYVPDVGVMYRIKAESLPEACTEDTHVEFSWNMEGPAGPPGPPGAGGISGLEIVQSGDFSVPIQGAGGFEVIVEGEATCPAGKSVIGGGTQLKTDVSAGNVSNLSAREVVFLWSRPSGTTKWSAAYANASAMGPIVFTVSVICANV